MASYANDIDGGNPFPLDDLPARRLRDVLILLHYLRASGTSLTVSPGSKSFGVAWDAAATGHVTLTTAEPLECPGCGGETYRTGRRRSDPGGLTVESECRACGGSSYTVDLMRVALVTRRAAR